MIVGRAFGAVLFGLDPALRNMAPYEVIWGAVNAVALRLAS